MAGQVKYHDGEKATASVSFNVRHMARHERNADASFADQFQNRTGHWTREEGRDKRNAES